MRLTKLEHATLVLEESAKTLIVDPGSFTSPITDSLSDPSSVVAVVVTHEHADHWTPEQLNRLLEKAPGIPIFAPEGVQLAADGFDVTVVKEGDEFTVEPFTLKFFGSKHAVIHSSIPVVDNVGVLINDVLYYPGDSFTVPEGVDVDVLAVPVGAPWLKIGEVLDYVLEVAPKRSFATHEMVLSAAGKAMGGDRIRWATEQGGGEYFALAPGDTLDL
ncbi:MBL fold metallo-hydrolase [Subtercola lobariae]|uniref:MBL fold metallo-hydrolase n=1 Tax=Subtercola lobariae TaxID=1588641 RepID=A0A917EW45_9MICO|nr:MBL fold metallo-hydrolase [Subtercola lobariae]GGF14738.1 MBL fold metallo-hydrolase [Subtercola lobariae]